MTRSFRTAALVAAFVACAFAQTATQLVNSDASGFAPPFPAALTSFPVPQAGGISADGRYVAFSTNQIVDPSDTNDKLDVYVKDLKTGACVRVSVASDGTQGNDALNLFGGLAPVSSTFGGALSANGRFVVFQSTFSNLVVGDTNGLADVFLHDRDADEDGIFDETGPGDRKTVRCSVTSAGVEGATAGTTASSGASVSDDGRHVCFQSGFTNLVAGDTNGAQDVFVHDRDVNGGSLADADLPGNIATIRMSVKADFTEAGTSAGSAVNASISGDGRHVTFSSSFTNLLAPETNGNTTDIFVRDRDADDDGVFDETGAGEQGLARVNLKSNGTQPATGEGTSTAIAAQAISANGRFVVMLSAVKLVPADLDTLTNVYVRDRDGDADGIFDEGPAGLDGTYWIDASADSAASGAAISPDGRFVAFRSAATNLWGSDTNGAVDTFTFDRTLGVMTRVSVKSLSNLQEGVTGGGPSQSGSANGNLDVASNGVTAFRSASNNMSVADSPPFPDLFVNGPFPRTQAATPSPVVGGSLAVSFKAPFHAGMGFLAGASFDVPGSLPATFLGNGLVLPMHSDALLIFSLTTPAPVFLGYSGTLDANGEATGLIAVPNDPGLASMMFLTGFVVLDPSAPTGVGPMSNAFWMQILP